MGILIEKEHTSRNNSEYTEKAAIENQHILSIIVPVYNEETVIIEFQNRLRNVLDGLSMTTEIIYINDGSNDTTLEVLDILRKQDDRIYLLDLSRNFGKELAMTAGLDHACGDAVVIIDADLQDPPELIPDMLDAWQQGFDVVYMKRRSRKGETWFKRLTAYGFYKLISKLGKVKIPENVGDFRLMDRRAVKALCSLREENRFMKGLFAWVGYSQKALLYDRDKRFAGETKWNYFKLWTLSLEGLTSFSTAPLKLASMLGLSIAGGAFFYGLWIIINTILFGESVRGYPTMMVVILFLGGVQLITTGILGEYLGRMFMETKQRPLYLLKGNTPARSTQKIKASKIRASKINNTNHE
ncbi:MAG TPA: glycosyltransferase [Gammaproteobacteria bacterium]|nr:glycosyltransferase [Gammaproteobacteria bacterium]